MDFEKLKSLISRALISSIFIYSIPNKIINFEKTAEVISSRNIPTFLSPILLFAAIFCLIFGSILFISGFKQKTGSILLLTFIIPTTIIFHFFPFQIRAVLMNAGLIGGLLLGLDKIKQDSLKDAFKNQRLKKNKNTN